MSLPKRRWTCVEGLLKISQTMLKRMWRTDIDIEEVTLQSLRSDLPNLLSKSVRANAGTGVFRA